MSDKLVVYPVNSRDEIKMLALVPSYVQNWLSFLRTYKTIAQVRDLKMEDRNSTPGLKFFSHVRLQPIEEKYRKEIEEKK